MCSDSEFNPENVSCPVFQKLRTCRRSAKHNQKTGCWTWNTSLAFNVSSKHTKLNSALPSLPSTYLLSTLSSSNTVHTSSFHYTWNWGPTVEVKSEGMQWNENMIDSVWSNLMFSDWRSHRIEENRLMEDHTQSIIAFACLQLVPGQSRRISMLRVFRKLFPRCRFSTTQVRQMMCSQEVMLGSSLSNAS